MKIIVTFLFFAGGEIQVEEINVPTDITDIDLLRDEDQMDIILDTAESLLKEAHADADIIGGTLEVERV